jgi:hypothetical protein
MLHDQFLSPNPSALFKMKVLASIDVEIKRNNFRVHIALPKPYNLPAYHIGVRQRTRCKFAVCT